MDFEFFERLTPDAASAFLANYIETERAAVSLLIADAAAAGVSADFSIESLAPLFAYVADQLDIEPVAPDDDLPEWIQRSSSYAASLYELAEPSRIVALRLSYYFGESFVQQFGLQWIVGDQDTALVNQPVVDGFRNGVQLAPLLVTENLLRSLIDGESGRVAVAVETWTALIA